MSLLDAGVSLVRAASAQALTHPLKLLTPGATTRVWSDNYQEFEISEADTVELWTGLGSLQPNLQRADVTPGVVGGTPMQLGTHRAYLPNSKAVREALAKAGLFLVDDLSTSPTYQTVFELLQDAVAMAGSGSLRLQLRVKA